MRLAEKIKILMKRNNVKSVYSLSQETKIPYSTLSDISKKNVDIKISTAQKLCNYFGCTLDELLNDDIELSN